MTTYTDKGKFDNNLGNSQGPKPLIGQYSGFDHMVFWVGNAKQAAHFYCTRCISPLNSFIVSWIQQSWIQIS